MTLIYLDTETTGLDPQRHHIWEIAYAVDDGPVNRAFVPHTTVGADEKALEIGQYYQRGGASRGISYQFEHGLRVDLEGATLVGANPAFDAAFLAARWGESPWHYRLLDVESYAMGALGYDKPQGLKTIANELRAMGHEIPEPDHTAAGDVATLRACHLALALIYGPIS